MNLKESAARLRWSQPVLRREMILRMRAPWTAWLLCAHVLILGTVTFLYLYRAADTSIGTAFHPRMGLVVFAFLTGAQIYLLAFLTPPMAAPAIAGERSAGKLGLMALHGMGPLSLLLGKLGAAVAVQLLMIIAAAPLYMTLLLFGGIGWREVFVAGALLLSVSLLVSAVSLAASALLHSEAAAILVAYLVMLALFGAPVTYHMLPRAPAHTGTARLQQRVEVWAEALSPGRVLSATLRLEGGGLQALALLAQAAGGVTVTNAQGGSRAMPLQVVLLDGSTLQLTPGMPVPLPPEPRLWGRPLWAVHIALMQSGTLLALLIGWLALAAPVQIAWPVALRRRGDRHGVA